MPRIRATQHDDATLKLDGLRAQQNVNRAIGKLWQYSHTQRRSSHSRRLSAFQAYFEDYIRHQPVDDDARSSLSPTPSPRSSPPPTFHQEHTIHSRRKRRREDTQRYWSWERQDSQTRVTTARISDKSRFTGLSKDENMHTMVTRSRTSRRTRFYKLRVPP